MTNQHFFTCFLISGLFLLNACGAPIPQEKTLAGYRYPIQNVLGKNPPPNTRYALFIYDEGTEGTRRVTARPAMQNEIGTPDTVTDENLFDLDGKTLSYAAFYDDWTIRQSVEVIFNEEGVLTKTITVTYDSNGTPVTLEEKPLL